MIEDKNRQLERYGRDLDKAKQEQVAPAIVSSTVGSMEVEAMKKALSDKREEVCHLSLELSGLKQELRAVVGDVESEKDARKEMEEVYQSNLADLRLKIQELEREAEESTRLHIHLEDALEEEINLSQNNQGFGGECTKSVQRHFDIN